MKFAFPAISGQCPRCGQAACAVYRGYYRRLLLCPEMEFLGPVVIRTAYCRRRQERFALLPTFLIPRRRISRLGFERLREEAARTRCLNDLIDGWMTGLGDEFYLPRSSARAYLALRLEYPP
jgi:hypothetical protein